MKSPFYFITKSKTGKRYNNTKDIGGIEFIINVSEEEHKFSSREAVVIETPLGYTGPIEAGDILLVHHNVFKFYNDMKGRRKSGKSFFKDDIFLIEEDQFFLYKKKDEWFAYSKYCFVKPIAAIDSYIKKPFAEEPLRGIMKYPNEYLLSQGIKPGDEIVFAPETDYEFNVDGEKIYRIYDHQITMKL